MDREESSDAPTIVSPMISDGRGMGLFCQELQAIEGIDATPLSLKYEFKVVQGLLQNIKFVLSFPGDVLREQGYYWLKITPIKNATQRGRIAATLGRHCHTPSRWLAVDEIEIDIHPERRVYHSD